MSENMLFCLGDGKYESKGEGYQKNYRIFNKDVSQDEWNKIKNSLTIEIQQTKWTDKKDMSAEEKKNVSGWSEMGGYLKTFSYEEVWKNFWDNASQKEKNQILDIPQFDSIIFREITGLTVETGLNLEGKEVKIDGKTYKAVIQ
jgi:hypothetical protein